MQHLRNKESQLALLVIDYDALSAKFKTTDDREKVLIDKVAHQKQTIYALEDEAEKRRVDMELMREEFASAKLHVVRLQNIIDLKNASETARVKSWDVFRRLYTLDQESDELAFENVKIGDEGAMIVSSSMDAFTALTSLSLAGNNIGLRGIDALSVPLIETKLRIINFSHNWLGDDAAPTLAVVIKNTGVQTINLSSNRISCEGAVVLARVLEGDAQLTSLKLEDNRVGVRGIQALSQALLVNTSLSFLSIKQNQIGDYGSTSVASMLRLNQGLTDLNLVANDIRDAGIRELCAGLAENFTLRNLRLLNNDNMGPASKKLLVTMQQTSVSKKLRIYF